VGAIPRSVRQRGNLAIDQATRHPRHRSSNAPSSASIKQRAIFAIDQAKRHPRHRSSKAPSSPPIKQRAALAIDHVTRILSRGSGRSRDRSKKDFRQRE
jgi:hypothetical protein